MILKILYDITRSSLAGWLVAALLALVAVLAAMAEAVKSVGRAGRQLCCHGCEGMVACRGDASRQAGGACTKKEPGVPRCHLAVPMQNEQYGLSQGGLLRSGRNCVVALCGPLQERRRRQSADTGEASMGDAQRFNAISGIVYSDSC